MFLPDQEPVEPATDLPPLPFWHARSFWLTITALLGSILPVLGVDWPWVSDPTTVDTIMQVVSGVAAVLAWQARVNPHRRLALKG
jgi:hypothetical protein